MFPSRSFMHAMIFFGGGGTSNIMDVDADAVKRFGRFSADIHYDT